MSPTPIAGSAWSCSTTAPTPQPLDPRGRGAADRPRPALAPSDTPARRSVYVHPDDAASARDLLERLEQAAGGDQL